MHTSINLIFPFNLGLFSAYFDLILGTEKRSLLEPLKAGLTHIGRLIRYTLDPRLRSLTHSNTAAGDHVLREFGIQDSTIYSASMGMVRLILGHMVVAFLGLTLQPKGQ